ncbi:MAG: ParB/RepB/Spo0J family partition protein [Bacteroidales bacterium]|nr:ParB/RepB/Spo0J family partition protein [Bacteroidales bacterium]HPD95518.1 ParB/RepB/Spo0J family partition protein [Tenuifilaceae bacterium]HRX31118.1 ParB/RepB/Spo0J family partition protein [Tenuifilaceae bacterium]
MSKKNALGRGLGALIEDANVDNERGGEYSSSRVVRELVNEIEVEKIDLNPFQPRTNFDEDAIRELAESIKTLGIIQPLTVRDMNGRYQLISGERRLRAAKLVGLKTVPAFTRTVDDQAMLEMALVENIQRQDLNAIEVAISYQRLIDECNLTQESLADRVGKKRTTVTNYIRLLKLPAEIQLGIGQQAISMGHARALVAIDNQAVQLGIYKQIVEKGLSVRKVEELVREFQNPSPKEAKSKKENSLDAKELELKEHLTNKLGLRADLKPGNNGDGKIVISYKTAEEFEDILEKFYKISE